MVSSPNGLRIGLRGCLGVISAAFFEHDPIRGVPGVGSGRKTPENRPQDFQPDGLQVPRKHSADGSASHHFPGLRKPRARREEPQTSVMLEPQWLEPRWLRISHMVFWVPVGHLAENLGVGFPVFSG